MAYVVTEQQQSRSMSYDGGRITASRTFKVYATSPDSIDSPSDLRSLFGTATTPDAMPARGSLFPDETGVWAKSYQVEHEPGTDVWSVTWSYSNAEVTSSSAQPGEPGFVEWTLDIQATFADTWRENPNYPTDGTVAANPDQQAVTGGNAIDIEGVPLSRLKYTSELVVNETIQNVSGVPSIITAARAARGKRNSATWEGFAKGTVLYTGAKISRSGVSLYTVSHRFVEDSEYHLVQFPERDSTGKIPTSPNNGRNRATKILWRQPFPLFYDFTTISPNW